MTIAATNNEADRTRPTANHAAAAAAPISIQKIFSDTFTQQYQTLLGKLEMVGFGPNAPRNTVGITSAARGEGVTSVACNFALYAAGCRQMKVLLVDANASYPELHSIFETRPSPGLIELSQEHLIEDCITDFSQIPFKSWPLAIKNAYRCRRSFSRLLSSAQEAELKLPLSVLPAGRRDVPLRPLDIAENMDFVNNVFSEFDLVIVDLPAMQAPNSSCLTPSQLDGILYVVESGATVEFGAKAGLDQLRHHGANVLGAVFNATQRHLPKWLDKRLGN